MATLKPDTTIKVRKRIKKFARLINPKLLTSSSLASIKNTPSEKRFITTLSMAVHLIAVRALLNKNCFLVKN